MAEPRSRIRAGSFACGVLAVLAAHVAIAFPLRSPQVALDSAALQSWMNAADGGVHVATDQLDAQQFGFADLGCVDGSLRIVLDRGRGLAVGFYDTRAGVPPASSSRYGLFDSGSTPGWWCVVSRMGSGDLRVALLDSLGVFQGVTVFPGVPADRLGLYVSGSSGTWYSEDARNGGDAHVLTFAGTGVHVGSWYMCAEPVAVSPPTLARFDGAILRFDMLCGLPVHTSSWGRLKSIYR